MRYICSPITKYSKRILEVIDTRKKMIFHILLKII
jgi:hypothetical protein